MSIEQIAAEQLKEWYQNFIRIFREECQKLTDAQKKQLLKNSNYLPKCQIEVFWLKHPNWQLVVATRFEDREDLEIIVNGPYDSNKFQVEMEKIIVHPRWNKLLYSKPRKTLSDSPRYYNEEIAEWLHRFVETAKNALFVDYNTNLNLSQWINLENGTYIEHFFGDKRKFDPKALVKNMIKEANEQLEHVKKIKEVPDEKQSEVKHLKGFGAYFLPQIVVGKLPQITVKDKIYGVQRKRRSLFGKEQFVVEFGKTKVIIMNDGFVGVCSEDRNFAIDIINIIMATSEMEGLYSLTVRDHEMVDIEYDPEKLTITSYAYSQNVTRNEPFLDRQKENPDNPIREIEEKTIKNIANISSKIFLEKEASRMILNYGEMLRHIKESEYNEAFLSGWKTIELYISQKWRKYKEQTDGKPSKWMPSADTMLKYLRGNISTKNFKEFMIMKKIRNMHLHYGEIISKAQAEDCLKMTQAITSREYQKIVQQSM